MTQAWDIKKGEKMTREEILQAFDDINFVYNDCTRYDTLKRMLEELTERKHGEWIDHKCSVCGFEPYDPSGMEKFNYCSNCGADMRGTLDD